MTLPPERITVKRRRDEDPVEALYIQAKKQRPGVIWKLQSRPNSQHQSSPKFATEPTGKNPAAPTFNAISSSIRSQTPESSDRHAESNRAVAESENNSIRDYTAANHASLGSTNISTGALVGGGKINRLTTSRLRRYFLTHESYSSLKHQSSFTGKIQKRQKPQRDRLAVFVESEKGEELIERTIRDYHGTGSDEAKPRQDRDNEVRFSSDSTTRKRPNVTATERAWRSDAWGKQIAVRGKGDSEKKNQPPSNWDDVSLQITHELQQIAIEHSRGPPEYSPATKLKFQPKPPKRRPPTHSPAENLISIPATRNVLDEDGDYIIDTYIRAPSQIPHTDTQSVTSLDLLQDMDTRKVGILVVEEDQDLPWEGFGDEIQSEAEFESDEEDENAEDFYGNDYPEEEVDADDEYGRGSCIYRIDASDDEEYGGDEVNWSDAEDESFH